MPKYEKVDAHTLKIIVEKASDVPLSQLIGNKAKIEEEIKRMQGVLKNINEMLKEAKKLGITPKPKDKDVNMYPPKVPSKPEGDLIKDNNNKDKK